MKRKMFNWMLVIALIVSASWKSYKEGFFRVKNFDIQITFANDLSEHFKNELHSELLKYKDQEIWNVSIEKIELNLNKKLWISEYRVHRRLPNTIVIELKPKDLVSLIHHDKNIFSPLTAEGEVLNRINLKQIPRLPVLLDEKIISNQNVRSKVSRVLRELPTEGPLKLSEISEVNIGQNQEIWLKHLSTQSLIKLGEENTVLKAERVSKVLEYLEQNNLDSRVIDAEFAKKVLVKLRNDR